MTDYLIGHVEWNSPDIGPVVAQYQGQANNNRHEW